MSNGLSTLHPPLEVTMPAVGKPGEVNGMYPAFRANSGLFDSEEGTIRDAVRMMDVCI